MISFETSGSFSKLDAFLAKMSRGDMFRSLDRLAQAGVDSLSAATPSDSGATAGAWSYRIKNTSKEFSIEWSNSAKVAGVPLVILLQYGHGTGTGGYVQGRDFINPALRPVFDQIASDVWRVVVSA